MADDTEKTAEEIARAAEAAGIAAEKIREFEEGMKDAATQAEAIKNLFEALNTASESSVGTAAERLEQDRERIRLASQLINLASRTEDIESNTLNTMRETVDERRRINALLVNEEKLIERAKTKLIGYKEETLSIKYHLMAIGDIWTNMSNQEALGRIINNAANAMFSFANAIFQASIEFDKVAASVAKATSTTQFKGAMESLRTEALATGVSVEELGQNFITLNNNFTDFNRLDAEAARQLASTATSLNAANFSAEAFAKTLDMGTKALGMSTEQVQTFSLELVNFGRAAGIPLDRLSRDLAASGAKIVEFGANGEKVFKELALASKNLGIEMDRMFGIAEQYTTFEGAAGAAAKLNSILGGNFVNSLDLMNTALENPTDTFRLLKDSMDASGKSFGDMTPAMKKVIAEAGGFSDISEAARVFNMDVDEASEYLEEQAIKQEELNKMNREFMGFQEKINKLLAQMIPIVTPIIDSLSSMINTLSEFAKQGESILKSLGWVTAFTVGGALVVKFVLIMAANIALLGKSFMGLATIFTTTFGLIKAGPKAILELVKSKLVLKKTTEEVVEAEKKASIEREKSSRDSSFEKRISAIASASKGAWKEILAFGVAIALVGVGIAAAAFGMSYLVESFKDIKDNAFAAIAGIAMLGVTFAGTIIAFAFGIKIMGAAALMAAPGILAFGGAIALIGIGIGVVAVGIAQIVQALPQLADLFREIAGIDVLNLLLLGPALAGIAVGLTAITAVGAGTSITGLLGIGPLSVLQDMSKLATDTFASNMEKIANSVEKIVSALSTTVNSNLIEQLERMERLSQVGAFQASPTTVTASPPIISVQDIVVRNTIRTEEGEQITQKGPTNISLTVPVKIDGSDFKDVIVGIVKEQIRANSDNGASVNTRTE